MDVIATQKWKFNKSLWKFINGIFEEKMPSFAREEGAQMKKGGYFQANVKVNILWCDITAWVKHLYNR